MKHALKAKLFNCGAFSGNRCFSNTAGYSSSSFSHISIAERLFRLSSLRIQETFSGRFKYFSECRPKRFCSRR